MAVTPAAKGLFFNRLIADIDNPAMTASATDWHAGIQIEVPYKDITALNRDRLSLP